LTICEASSKQVVWHILITEMEHFWSTSGAPLKGLFPLGFEVLKLADLEVFRRIRIDVQGGRYISMSQSILNHFDVYPRFVHSGSKGVAEAVTTEVW